MVHRDVKPSNIVVTDQGTVLVDFGLTRGLPDGQRLSGISGTPGYLAPEATEAGVYTPATDRYAFGGVAYFVLTGTEPPSTHTPEVMRASLASVPALADRPDAVDQVMSMLDTDPAARPPALANWLGQLRHSSLTGLPEILAPAAPGRNPQPARPDGGRRRQRRRRFRWPAVALAVALSGLLAAAGLAVRAYSDRDQGNPPASGPFGSADLPGAPTPTGAEPAGPGFNPTDELPTIGQWQAFDAGPLATRAEPKAVWTGTEMLVVGGLAVEQYAAFSDGAAFQPETGTWRRIASRPAPGRIMVATWTGSELFALGQQEGIDLEDMRSAHLYDPDSDTWRAASPPPRGFNSPEGAWWTGREVLVWQVGGGMLYDPAMDRWRDVPAIDIAGATAPGRATWLEGADVLAVQGAMTPDNGGPLREALFLFDSAASHWRAAAPLPAPLPSFNMTYAGWLGTELVFNPDPEGPTYAYNAVSDSWRELPTPAVQRDRGTAYFIGVPISEQRSVIRVGDSRHPLVVADADRRWSYSSSPDGRLPAPDGVMLWTGSEVILWGRPEFDPGPDAVANSGSSLPNGAWRWTP